MQGRRGRERSETAHETGETQEGRTERKKGGIDGLKEGESATGSFSASYRWPPARVFRH